MWKRLFAAVCVGTLSCAMCLADADPPQGGVTVNYLLLGHTNDSLPPESFVVLDTDKLDAESLRTAQRRAVKGPPNIQERVFMCEVSTTMGDPAEGRRPVTVTSRAVAELSISPHFVEASGGKSFSASLVANADGAIAIEDLEKVGRGRGLFSAARLTLVNDADELQEGEFCCADLCIVYKYASESNPNFKLQTMKYVSKESGRVVYARGTAVNPKGHTVYVCSIRATDESFADVVKRLQKVYSDEAPSAEHEMADTAGPDEADGAEE